MPVDSGVIAFNLGWMLEQIGCLSSFIFVAIAIGLIVLFVKVNYNITKKDHYEPDKWKGGEQ